MTLYEELQEELATTSRGEYLYSTWLIDCDDGTQKEYPESEQDIAHEKYAGMCDTDSAVTLYEKSYYEGGHTEERYVDSNC